VSGIESGRQDASLAVWGAHTLERNWPALLVGSACVGLGLSNWVSPGSAQTVVLALIVVLGVALFDGSARVVVLGVALLAMGLWWGTLRLEAMGESALSAEIGSAGPAEVIVTGPARHSAWSLRVPAEVRAFRGERLRERVLLLLPVERSPPQGAILEAEVIVSEPRGGTGGFDERAWLARQGIHVVLRAREWHQVGHRGGIAGLGDRLHDRVQEAIERGTSGRRRALVLGIVLGEDEDLSVRVHHDFRASGLYHLLGDSAFSRNASEEIAQALCSI
jgi:predicted membrane metal-binding protein